MKGILLDAYEEDPSKSILVFSRLVSLEFKHSSSILQCIGVFKLRINPLLPKA